MTTLHSPRPMMNQAARVLVVDDDPDMCAYLVAGLATAGIESKIALDGVQAIECLQSRPPGWFGLILLDVSMPKQNGWELLDSDCESPEPPEGSGSFDGAVMEVAA